MAGNKSEKQPLVPSYGGVDSNASMKKQAQAAHDSRDADLSILVHKAKAGQKASENHLPAGDHIKSAVYGGLDGIITTFATVTSVAGSGLPHSVILILGLAHLVSDGLSMGMGDYLSSQAENQLVKRERAREEWEFENFPEGEIDEMIEIYEEKGISSEDARLVVNTLAKYKDAFVDIMMVDELQMLPVDEDESAVIGGFITFFSFMLFGIVPLLSYLVNLIPGVNMSSDQALMGSSVLTIVTMFLLGAVKGTFVGQKWYHSGFWMALNGGVAAGSGWVIGALLGMAGIQDVA